MDSLPQLSAIEQRVLGALIEKSKTTPEYYPMSLNALTAACNQKTSRKPVTNYSEEEVMAALSSLKGISLAATAVGAGNRTLKFKHNFTTVFPLTDAQLAVICLLLLRGPLTPGEINSNAGRLHSFSSLESVLHTLDEMASLSPAMVHELSKQAGQKEIRFTHLLGHVSVETIVETNNQNASQPASESLQARIENLEMEVEQIRQQLNSLLNELNG